VVSSGLNTPRLRQTRLNKSTILLVSSDPHVPETLNVTNKSPRCETKALFKH